MSIAIWVLGSLLLGAVIAAAVFYRRLTAEEHKLFMERRQSEYLRGDRDYYIRQTSNYQRRYTRAVDGLTAVQNLRTGKMANIGHRMYQAATEARNAALSEPFDKA